MTFDHQASDADGAGILVSTLSRSLVEVPQKQEDMNRTTGNRKSGSVDTAGPHVSPWKRIKGSDEVRERRLSDAAVDEGPETRLQWRN
ncbi:hypothetical protein NDU88_007742 [Pleurodeles waltl]|uniref:Uncharacterized protein n=1 Tax=Pleurodeles waltl TaxID=8319 RepID=A0AAV7NWV7_PLEWA|nr:hypothetical protein NDU88_007742 [Pleurodeles waltl]